MPDAPYKANGELSFEGAEAPGLLDHLAVDRPPGRDELTSAVENFLRDRNVTDTELAEEIRKSTEPEVSTEGFRDMWEAIKHAFRPVELVVVDTQTKDVPLEAYWLTLPTVPGASVTLTSSSTTSDEKSGSLTILGIGGGPTFTFAITRVLDFEADDQQCVELLAPGTFEQMRAMKGEKLLRSGFGSAP